MNFFFIELLYKINAIFAILMKCTDKALKVCFCKVSETPQYYHTHTYHTTSEQLCPQIGFIGHNPL